MTLKIEVNNTILISSRHAMLGPLFWAVSNQQPAAVRFLIRLGCDKNIADKNGLTPLAIALRSKNRELKISIQMFVGVRPLANVKSDSVQLNISADLISRLFIGEQSHAINRSRQLNISILAAYASLTFVLVFLTIFINAFIWIGILIISAYFLR